MRFIIGCCVALGAFSQAYADPTLPDPTNHAWFYNNASVSVAQSESDLEQCLQFGAERANGSSTHQPWGLMGDVVIAMIETGSPTSFTDDCMIAKGYARYDLIGETLAQFRARYDAMPEEERAYLVSNTPPSEGVLARHPSNTHWLSAPRDAVAELRPITPRTYAGRIGRFSRPRQNFTGLVPQSGQALLIGSIASPNGDLAAVTLTRVNRVTGLPDPLDDQERTVFLTRSREPVTMGIIVEAGTYALTNSDMTEFCLGTIGFDAPSGAIVDLGVITVDEEPTASNDPFAPVPTKRVRIDDRGAEASAALMGSTVRIERASYANGFVVPCHAAMRQSIAGIFMPGASQVRE